MITHILHLIPHNSIYIKDGKKGRKKKYARKMYFLCLWEWYEDGRNPFHVFNIRQIEDYPRKKNTKRMPIKVLELHYTSRKKGMGMNFSYASNFTYPLLETSIENQMMSYLEMKLASLVAVVVSASFVLQAAMHCLLVEAVLVDSIPLDWKYFHWNYSEPQQLLLAVVI